VRALDVNAFDPIGVSEPALRFIEALLALCLLTDSPPTTADEQAVIGENQLKVARHGREPGLELQHDGKTVRLNDWAREILGRMAPLCALLDAGDPTHPYSSSLEAQHAVVADPELAPSARVLAEMRRRGESFFRFTERMSAAHKRQFLETPLDPATEARFAAQARSSLEKQAAIEAADTLSFDEYLHRYFSQS